MQATHAAVRREITVNAAPEKAFRVFTERFDAWWPRTFTAAAEGTRVELEHRHFERHGATAEALRDAVGGDGGWNGLLKLYEEALGSS